MSDRRDLNKVILGLLEYINSNNLYGSILYSGGGCYVGLHTKEDADKIEKFLEETKNRYRRNGI